MLENEENKMNTENNESEVKNESNIENVETVKNDAEDSATNKATEEMFEESDFVTPPQDVEETADAAQADTVQTSETDQAQNCEAQTDEDHIKGTEGASQYRYSYIKNHQKQDHVGGDRNSNHQETPQQRRKHRHSMNVYAKVVCCAILFGAISGGMILGSFAIGKNSAKSVAAANLETNAAKLSTNSGNKKTDASGSTDGTYTVAEIASQCKSSVVAITNQSVQEVQTMFGTMQQQSTGSGSGVIIGKNDTELLIATNNHVVSGAESLTVCFNDNKDAVFDAKIKGTDPNNDLAVIAIQLSDISEDVLNSISIATLGDSTQMEVGDQVVAIGNALGFGQSVTTGIISAVDREVTIDDTTATLLQTDAAINPGNSGGALFNMKGEVIGINSAKYASDEVEGMGFAIPISKAQEILNNLMTKKTREAVDESAQGYLGIQGTNIDANASKEYGMPVGIYVYKIVEGGAAANSDLKEKDIITKFDGQSVTNMEELKQMLTYYEGGSTVELTVQSLVNGVYVEHNVQITLGTKPASNS